MIRPPEPDDTAVIICVRMEDGPPAVPSTPTKCAKGGEGLWLSVSAGFLIAQYPQTQPVCVQHVQEMLDEDNPNVIEVQAVAPLHDWHPSHDS